MLTDVDELVMDTSVVFDAIGFNLVNRQVLGGFLGQSTVQMRAGAFYRQYSDNPLFLFRKYRPLIIKLITPRLSGQFYATLRDPSMMVSPRCG